MSGTTRREFLSQLGVTTVAAVGGTAAGVGLASAARAEEKPKGKIPDTPFKIGHMTFFTGAGAVLADRRNRANPPPQAGSTRQAARRARGRTETSRPKKLPAPTRT